MTSLLCINRTPWQEVKLPVVGSCGLNIEPHFCREVRPI